MTDAESSQAWVEVMRTGGAAEKPVRDALREAGIPVRTHKPGVVGRLLKGRRSLEVLVRAQDEARARAVLDDHLAQGEANIEKHLQRLPAELSVGGGGILAVVGLVFAGVHGAAWGWGVALLGVVVFAWGWTWIRAHPPAG